VRSDHGGVAGERDGSAEEIEGSPVGGDELGLLAPDRTAADEDVRRALARVGAYAILPRPNDDGIAGERDGVAEGVARGSVRGGELGLLGPHRTAADEDVGRALALVDA